MREALSSPLPVSGLTLSAFAAPFRGTAPNVSVAIGVEVRGRDLTFSERDGVFLDDLELSLMATDSSGKVRAGDRRTVNMKLRPQTYEAVMRQGFRVISQLDMPPGRYQVRVAARESGRGKVGSVHLDLEVPDFAGAPLLMSGLVITSGSASRLPTAGESAALKGALSVPPTAIRQFSAGDVLAVFAEIYDNQGSTPHQVDIMTTLRADAGTVVYQSEDARRSEELQGARGGWVEHAGRQAPPPAIDLSRRVVAGVFLGSRPSAGFDVEITGVACDAQACVITYTESRPIAGQMAAQIVTSPFHLITLERTDVPIRFVREGTAVTMPPMHVSAPRAEASSTGLAPRVAATLSYAAWWITGLLFLIVERESEYVRFHAKQSAIGLGAIFGLGLFLLMVSGLTLLISATWSVWLFWAALAIWVAGAVVSLACAVKAWQGERWSIPVFGRLAGGGPSRRRRAPFPAREQP
ncbi:MAG: protease complex subunit PrcB family protein [Acidobacteria bacterium]|nr:protease complex subunit PrcB family protein [Acidobacteriota bacterium]